LIAGIVAASLGTSVLTDATAILIDSRVVTKRMVYGGAAFRTERSNDPTAVVALSFGVFQLFYSLIFFVYRLHGGLFPVNLLLLYWEKAIFTSASGLFQ